MSKAVDIFSGILFVRTRHYDDVKKVIVLQGNKPERRFFEERPQGKWVEIERQGRTGDGRIFTYPIVVCSNCGEQYDLEGEKFCPHCGADMRGKE